MTPHTGRVLCSAIVVVLLIGCDDREKVPPTLEPSSKHRMERTMDGELTLASAIEIATRDLISQGLIVKSDGPPIVERIGEIFVVTFPATLPPGTVGGAFYARLHINATTGEVVKRETSA